MRMKINTESLKEMKLTLEHIIAMVKKNYRYNFLIRLFTTLF